MRQSGRDAYPCVTATSASASSKLPNPLVGLLDGARAANRVRAVQELLEPDGAARADLVPAGGEPV